MTPIYLHGTEPNNDLGDIYLLWFPEPMKAYVGLAVSGVARRVKRHISEANGNGHYIIHNAIRKYGAPMVFVIDQGAPEELPQREREWIEELGTAVRGIGYNMTWGGEGTLGLQTIKNLKTGKAKSWPKGEPPPRGWAGTVAGMVTCKNLATGDTAMFPRGRIPDGWVPAATGMTPCNSLATGKAGMFPKDEIPEGWVSKVAFNSTVLASLRSHLFHILPKVELLERSQRLPVLRTRSEINGSYGYSRLIDTETKILGLRASLGLRQPGTWAELVALGVEDPIPGEDY